MITNNASNRSTTTTGDAVVDSEIFAKEAQAFLTLPHQIVAQKMALKSALATELTNWIMENKLSHADAAGILNVSRARLANALTSPPKASIDALVDMAIRSGMRVRPSVEDGKSSANSTLV